MPTQLEPAAQLRLLTHLDLEFADGLRALVGWNQTPADWRRFLASEPEGCFLAEYEGRAAGTATTTRYGSDLAWIGMVMVHPDFRGHGLGRALLQHCLSHLQQTRTRSIKLDATPLGQPLYESLGFHQEWALARWEAAGVEVPATLEEAVVDVRGWEKLDRRALDRLDSTAFGCSRLDLLDSLARTSVHAIVDTSDSGVVRGYGLLRGGAKALYLGPVVARSPSSASKIIHRLLGQAQGRRVFWDVPDPNLAAGELAVRFGFVRQRALLRMVHGSNLHPGDPLQQFAIADPALG